MQATAPIPTLTPAERRHAAERNALYLLSLLPAAVVVFGNLTGGWWSVSNLVFSFVVLAALELLLPFRDDNIASDDDRLPNFILHLHLLAQLATLGSLFYGIQSGILQGWAIVGAVVSTGINSGSAAITVGHELCHRKQAYWRWGSKWLLFSSGNPYFYVAHVQVHHKLVATHDDSTTARYGEHLYAFFFRSVAGQLRDTFRYEAERLRKAGKAPYGLGNYGVASLLLMVAACAGLYAWLGWVGVAAWLGQALLANFLLEYINYIEHYGLQRRKDARGLLQRVNHTHAWHSEHCSRFFLVDLSRHPDHHVFGARPYHTLRHYPESPQMPAGYSGMIYLALVPPVFFRVMNPRVQAYYAAADAAAATAA